MSEKIDWKAFCPQCGLGVGFDEDGCCTSCGATTCSGSDLRALLAEHGLSIVGEADMAVLRATDAFTLEDLEVAAGLTGGRAWMCLAEAQRQSDASMAWGKACLARRAAQKGGGS